jgi:hypothetical protein
VAAGAAAAGAAAAGAAAAGAAAPAAAVEELSLWRLGLWRLRLSLSSRPSRPPSPTLAQLGHDLHWATLGCMGPYPKPVHLKMDGSGKDNLARHLDELSAHDSINYTFACLLFVCALACFTSHGANDGQWMVQMMANDAKPSQNMFSYLLGCIKLCLGYLSQTNNKILIQICTHTIQQAKRE